MYCKLSKILHIGSWHFLRILKKIFLTILHRHTGESCSPESIHKECLPIEIKLTSEQKDIK